jgi:hypothetical protein
MDSLNPSPGVEKAKASARTSPRASWTSRARRTGAIHEVASPARIQPYSSASFSRASARIQPALAMACSC